MIILSTENVRPTAKKNLGQWLFSLLFLTCYGRFLHTNFFFFTPLYYFYTLALLYIFFPKKVETIPSFLYKKE